MLILVPVIALLALSCDQTAPKLDVVCDTPGHKILFGEKVAKRTCFTREQLINYFSQFLTYPETDELEVFLVPDKKLLTQSFKGQEPRWIPVAECQDWRLPKERPLESSVPFAVLRKFGLNVFLEFRDLKGALDTVVLRGENVWSSAVEGFPVFVVGHAFFSKEDSTGCAQGTSRTLIVVAPRFSDMTFDQLISVCRHYVSLFGSTELNIRIFASAQEARRRASFTVPSVAALKNGFESDASDVSRLVWFNWDNGEGVAVLLKATTASECGDVGTESKRIK